MSERKEGLHIDHESEEILIEWMAGQLILFTCMHPPSALEIHLTIEISNAINISTFFQSLLGIFFPKQKLKK